MYLIELLRRKCHYPKQLCITQNLSNRRKILYGHLTRTQSGKMLSILQICEHFRAPTHTQTHPTPNSSIDRWSCACKNQLKTHTKYHYIRRNKPPRDTINAKTTNQLDSRSIECATFIHFTCSCSHYQQMSYIWLMLFFWHCEVLAESMTSNCTWSLKRHPANSPRTVRLVQRFGSNSLRRFFVGEFNVETSQSKSVDSELSVHLTARSTAKHKS